MALAGSMKGSTGFAKKKCPTDGHWEKWDVLWENGQYQRYKVKNLTKVSEGKDTNIHF